MGCNCFSGILGTDHSGIWVYDEYNDRLYIGKFRPTEHRTAHQQMLDRIGLHCPGNSRTNDRLYMTDSRTAHQQMLDRIGLHCQGNSRTFGASVKKDGHLEFRSETANNHKWNLVNGSDCDLQKSRPLIV